MPTHPVPAQGSLRFPHTAGGPCHSPAGQTLWGSLTPGMPLSPLGCLLLWAVRKSPEALLCVRPGPREWPEEPLETA